MYDETKKKLPVRKAVFWIFLSTLLISGSSGAVLFYYWNLLKMNAADPKYNIIAIVQQGPDKDLLKTEYLAELLGLSQNRPTNLFALSDAENRLLQSPLIKSVKVKKVKPGTLYIDYRVRKPIAFLSDFSNTAIDDEGVLIPFSPFFTPKKLPEVLLGNLETCKWGGQLSSDSIQWAVAEIKNNSQIRRVDLSQVAASSLGQREIILVLECPTKRILRLSMEAIPSQMANYHLLEKHLQTHPIESESLVIDLRIPDLAFLSPS